MRIVWTVAVFLAGIQQGVLENPDCFLPKPIEFSVEYHEGESLTLSWAVSGVPESASIAICPGSEVYEVQSRWYASFDDYVSQFRISGIYNELAEGTNYTLNISSIARNSYFVFDVKNRFRFPNNTAVHFKNQTVTTPVYYFERQGV